jgi:SAM-dependent methyltransferase
MPGAAEPHPDIAKGLRKLRPLALPRGATSPGRHSCSIKSVRHALGTYRRRVLSKACELEDFQDGPIRDAIREVFAHDVVAHGDRWPTGAEYRKHWEVAMAVLAFRTHGVLRPDAEVLGVGAGNEPTLYWLTNHVRRVFASDLYLGDEWAESAAPVMMVDPGRFWPGPWDPQRLVVQHMDGRELLHPDASIAGIFSSSSIEHFGDHADVARTIDEAYRVLEPGGVLSLSTELRVGGDAVGEGLPGILLFTPAQIEELVIRRCPWEPIQWAPMPSAATMAGMLQFADAIKDVQAHVAQHGAIYFDRLVWSQLPHLVLEHEGYQWTSVHLALRKPGSAR